MTSDGKMVACQRRLHCRVRLPLNLPYLRQRATRHLYLDHLTFSLHFQSAFFFALAAAWLVTRATGLGFLGSGLTHGLIALATLLASLPLALASVWRQARLWTTVTSVALLFIYLRLLGLVAIWKD
jgi:hypothetical protein